MFIFATKRIFWNMKGICCCCFIMFAAVSLFAQNIHVSEPNAIPRKMAPRDTLDNAYLNVHYRQTVRKDKLFPEDLTETEMVLQIGGKIAKYTNYRRLLSDSIMAEELKCPELSAMEIVNNSLKRMKKSGDNTVIVKNNQEGLYTTQQQVILNKYVYTEDKPVFDWTVASDTLTVLGYSCKKAVCLFRGREYTAWFAPDVPLMEGPWKFNGLPGLIMKVEDVDKDYSFEATALYQVTWKSPIYITKEKNDVYATREKVRQVEKAGADNPSAIIRNSGRVTLKGNENTGGKRMPYNPIELE